MNHLNSILLEGNVVIQPKLYTAKESGKSLSIFPIASDRYIVGNGKKRKETLFIRVEAWEELGEKAVENLDKGTEVRVLGRLKLNSWSTGDGNVEKELVIVACHIEYKSDRETKTLTSECEE